MVALRREKTISLQKSIKIVPEESEEQVKTVKRDKKKELFLSERVVLEKSIRIGRQVVTIGAIDFATFLKWYLDWVDQVDGLLHLLRDQKEKSREDAGDEAILTRTAQEQFIVTLKCEAKKASSCPSLSDPEYINSMKWYLVNDLIGMPIFKSLREKIFFDPSSKKIFCMAWKTDIMPVCAYWYFHEGCYDPYGDPRSCKEIDSIREVRAVDILGHADCCGCNIPFHRIEGQAVGS